ncbi:MAG TPA: radical SAM protein [Candidatus Omnitrophota bacterium]|nr:radical SAM protein [Candidatus Omnitrophota bacterium]HPS19516.1 radical SAM protein [Candidatus Omnitrophota bacterium]
MDSLLITVPVSSPLHPQAMLPCLQAFLEKKGFSVKSIDSNIDFFWYMLGKDYDISTLKAFDESPINVLSFYNKMESDLAKKSVKYKGCRVGLRSVKVCYNRTSFEDVAKAVYDTEANPFIEYYDQLIEKKIAPESPKIVGISITFQDQIVAAFTLARMLREKMPSVKIVLGGQMITRCHDTLFGSDELRTFWDYLVLWEGEVPLWDIHEEIINHKEVEYINVLVNGKPFKGIDRSKKGLSANEQYPPVFKDIEFDRYFYSDFLIPIQTSRSCYGKCEFCAIPFGANSNFRTKTADQLLEHVMRIKEEVKAKYGRDAIFFKFMDDTSLSKVLFEFSKKVEKMEVNIKWEAFVRLDEDYADDEFMAQLYRGGCRKLCWGLESSDPDILEKMNKKNTNNRSTRILNASAKAGILNFCFVLVGFPGETQKQRDNMTEYIINNPDVHVLTISTFDFTRFSNMHINYSYPNKYGLFSEKAQGFEVRLPYVIDGSDNWKHMIVTQAHEMLFKIISKRPDIGFMSLFPDQIRMTYCDIFGNGWGREFVKKYGEDNIRSFLTGTEDFIKAFKDGDELDVSKLPEPILREYHREIEDLEAIRQAIERRKAYENRRMDQV